MTNWHNFIKNGEKIRVNLELTDKTASLAVKKTEPAEAISSLAGMKPGFAAAIWGSCEYDRFDGELMPADTLWLVLRHTGENTRTVTLVE